MDRQNEELIRLSNQILDLTKAIHAMTATRRPAGTNAAPTQDPGPTELPRS